MGQSANHAGIIQGAIEEFSQEFAQVSYAAEQAMIAVMEVDPTLGLFSPTDASKGAILLQKVVDGLAEMVTGHTPVSGFDPLVKDWRSAGGDQIRTEFQQAYADSMK